MKIVTINPINTEHLEHVIEQMRSLGVPKIKAVWIEDMGLYVALEGTHRIAAAKALGLTPEIIDMPYSHEIVPDIKNNEGLYAPTVANLCDSAWSRLHLAYEF